MKTARFSRLFATLIALVSSTIFAAPGDLYVSDFEGNQILRFTPDGSKSIFVSGLEGPGALAFDRAGNLYVAERGSGTILKFAPDGAKSTFVSGLSSPASLAFDGASNLFVAESFGDIGDILKITPSGTKSIFISDGNNADLTFDTAGNLFVAATGAFSLGGGIFFYAPDGTRNTFSTFGGPGLAFDAAGDLFAGNHNLIVVYHLTPSHSESLSAPGLNDPFINVSGLAFDDAGSLYVADDGSGSIVKSTRDGTSSTFASGLTAPRFLAFEPVAEKLRNISARGLVGTGDGALIGGFIVGGNALANNAVLVRALGPSLSQAGVTNPLSDPFLELHNASGAVIASNDDWQETQEAEISASGLAPADPNESAIFAILPAGSYTAVVRGADDTTGVALVEVYSVGQ